MLLYVFVQFERRQVQLTKAVDDMKGTVSECHKEHGRLKTEEKVVV